MPSPNHPPAFQFYVDDFIADSAVDAMSNEEVGIYVRFLCKAWKEEPVGTIPADEKILANWSKSTPSAWKKCRTGVLRAFILEDGRYHQKRMKTEWQKLVDYRKKKEDAGSKGAEKRWHNHDSANGKPIAQPIANDSSSFSLSLSSSSSNEPFKSESSSGEPLKKFRPRGDYIDLSSVDWLEVASMAEAAAKRVRPRTIDDRRAWLTFAVLAVLSFGEHWLVDAAEGVARATETKQTKPAHFIGILKATAFAKHGVDAKSFNEMFKRIRIPDELWNSPVLGGPTP